MGPKSILAKKSDWGIPRPPHAAMGACQGCSLAGPGTGRVPARTVYRCTSMVVHYVGVRVRTGGSSVLRRHRVHRPAGIVHQSTLIGLLASARRHATMFALVRARWPVSGTRLLALFLTVCA